MKASKLYEWLFAEGSHVYDCEMIIDGEYVEDYYYLVKEHKNVAELSDKPSHIWCNEDIPCLFGLIPSLSGDSTIKITCTPMMPYAYKEVTFKASEWEDDIRVNQFNSAQIELKD